MQKLLFEFYIDSTSIKSFHPSPVHTLISVIKELENESKLSRLFIGDWFFTVENKFIPRTA